MHNYTNRWPWEHLYLLNSYSLQFWESVFINLCLISSELELVSIDNSTRVLRNLSSPLWFGLTIESWINLHLMKNINCWSTLCYANRPTEKWSSDPTKFDKWEIVLNKMAYFGVGHYLLSFLYYIFGESIFGQ